MNTKLMFSSKTDMWSTPQAFFDEWDEKYHFTLDACASPDNAKCSEYFTEEDDALQQEWRGVVWMNPPYGRKIKHWIKKAHDSAQEGATVVCLIPSRTDTVYWHEYVMKGDITFIKGRLKFGDAKNAAPFPSAVVVFNGDAA